jgi:peptide/nickel transport system substrate-binding protein
MADETVAMTRRHFLKRSGTAATAALLLPYLRNSSFAASRDRITIYHSSVADSLNPYNHSSSPIYGQWQHILEPLIDMDHDKLEYKGVLAESWEFKEKKCVFHLRKGVRFHNGAPFTAKDVIFSINRIKTDKNSLQAPNFKDVVEMEAPDDHTVVITLKNVQATFLDLVDNRMMLSKAHHEKFGDQMDQRPIGTGPYKFVSYQLGGNFVMTRNDEYRGAKPQIREVIFRKVAEDAARVAALEAGQADLINNVPIHEVARLQRSSRVRVEKVEGLRMFFLVLNPGHKPFDNKLVRQAANYAVDAPAIVKNIFEGNGFVCDGPVGRKVFGADPNLKRYPYDPKKSRELLTQAGYPNGIDVKFYYSAGRYPQDKEVCQAIAAQMAKGGFKVELISQEWAIFWGKEGVNGGKLPLYYIGRGSLLDADTLYDQYFRTGTSKRAAYSNPEFDKLIEDEQKTYDRKKRAAILRQAGKILMEDVPFVPLFNLADLYGVARNVEWKPPPDEKLLVADMKLR